MNVMRRIKDRLILGIRASLYELVPDATTPPTINGSTVPLYTVKDSAGWPWTGIADGPSGFYASSQSAPIDSLWRTLLAEPRLRLGKHTRSPGSHLVRLSLALPRT